MLKTKETFLIVDGHNLLFQMFFGMPARIVNHEGKAIQGVLGFVGALLKIMKQTSPQYIIVLFDGEHENKRAEILPEYKANRVDYGEVAEEDNPFSQLEDVYKALEFMGIPFIEVADVEADDVIASYVYSVNNGCAVRNECTVSNECAVSPVSNVSPVSIVSHAGTVEKVGEELQVIISSWDSDFFQLISDNVRVLRYRGKNTVLCDRSYVETKFGVRPQVYADFKSLVGDNSDNIKGAEKIGSKTASKLLEQYGSLREILEKADEIQGKSIRESLIRNKERLLINYELIKLNDNAPIPVPIEDLRYSGGDIKTNDVLKGIGLKL